MLEPGEKLMQVTPPPLSSGFTEISLELIRERDRC